MNRIKKLFTIENKILLPFVSITLLSLIGFFAVFYHMEYDLKLEQERINADTIVAFLGTDLETGMDEEEQRRLLDKYRASYHGKNLFLYDGAGELLYSVRPLSEQEVVLRDVSDNAMGWRILYSFDSKEMIDSFIYEQRYVILGAVAVLLIIMQASVYIAYNISAPICELSEMFTQISSVPERDWRMEEEYLQRWDEVGQLARAFQSMMARLHGSNDTLMKVKALNEGIVENIPMGVVVFGSQNQQVFQNQQAAEMLEGAWAADVSGRTLKDILSEMAVKAEILPVSAVLKDGEGKYHHYELGAWKLSSKDQRSLGTLYTIDDVTYQRRMEEKLSRDEKLAYTGELAAEIAHEVRNPLAGIRAGLQIVGKKSTDQRDQMLCTEMVREVDRVNILVENMVNISRKRESEKTHVALNVLGEEIELLYSKVAANKGVELGISMEPDLWVLADERELRQILINLINNSIKAMRDGGQVSLLGSGKNGEVSVIVEDNGPGMNQEQLGRMLRGETGGLGVGIVRRLVKQNGGRFKVESEPGKGTKIILTFLGTGGVEHEL